MEKKVKLIWDFRGPASGQTARHFLEHLQASPLCRPGQPSGVETLGENHSTAYLLIDASEIPRYRDALKPHRATYAE